MSLDVYLEMENQLGERRRAIFIRDDGSTGEISREEWDRTFPGREPHTVEIGGDKCVFERNVTHNLSTMAGEAGLYEPLWRPDELVPPITKAKDLIKLLQAGLEKLRSDPEKFKAFNPKNGWGDYECLVDFVKKYLKACMDWPEALVRVSR